ncbi:MAG TPA: hypothetical protein VFA56_10875 [Gaiellaceae bacterium]|nr:hypothetical protein [Gaiellaceae bacterium]
MTSHARVYVLALALVVFFLAWAVVAAHPWAAAAADPRLKALTLREQRLRRESRLVNELVNRRWAAYRVALRARRAQIASAKAATAAAAVQRASYSAAAPVRVVTLPPLTITRTS